MKIPKNIQELSKNPRTILDQYKKSGTKVIGYTCTNVPEEMIIAAGLQPYRISNIGANTSNLTPSFACPFASATLENMLKLEGHFSGFVVAHTCDLMWRFYDILKKKTHKPLFLLRVPHNTGNKLSLDFFKKEITRFKKFLEKNFNTTIENRSLKFSIKTCNQTRVLLKNLYMLNKGSKYGIDASDRFQITLASMWMPKPEFNAQIKALKLGDGKSNGEVRLHVNGTAIYDLNLFKMIEESGGFVASDDLCTGTRYFWDNVDASKEPISALADRYLKRIPCPAQDPLNERLDFIEFMVEKFNVQGVITYAEKFCDPILYDVVHIKNKMAKKRIPYLTIDFENPAQESGRIKTRVEAFIESLGD